MKLEVWAEAKIMPGQTLIIFDASIEWLNLAAKGYSLYYWESKYSAEIDFVLQKENEIIGVEVKKGEHVRSRSLSVFSDEYKPAYTIRFSLKNFGESNRIKSVPLYAVFCI